MMGTVEGTHTSDTATSTGTVDPSPSFHHTIPRAFPLAHPSKEE